MKPLLVGLHNPLSTHPRAALLPFPSGSTGWRLWMMMRDVDVTISRQVFMEGFDRRDLWRAPDLPTGPKSTAAYRAEGRILLDACRARADVVLLGARVWSAVADCRTPDWFECKEVLLGVRFWRIPHPSGRNVIYNSLTNRRRVGQLLLDLAS